MNTKIIKLWLAGAAALLGLSACSSTQLVQRWHDPAFSGPKLEKVLVLGVFKNESRRRAFEQTFSDQIGTAGLGAVPGYSLVPDAADIESEAAVAAAVRQAGADAVLITHFRGVTQAERQIPPRVDYLPAYGHGYGYYRYYAPVYRRVYRPGYTVVDSIVKLETQVYRVGDDKLVWSGNSESVNSASSDRIVKELAGLVVEDLMRSGLIEP